MSYRKVLVGIFMAGFLCCGIGAGVMFQEYSSFQYMGEKRIGSNKIAEKTFMENLYTDKTKKLNTSFTTYNNENGDIEAAWRGKNSGRDVPLSVVGCRPD